MNVNGTMWKRLAPLALTQFLGIFNDNAFKCVTILGALNLTLNLSQSYAKDAAFLAIVTAIYVFPFIVFSEWAGFLGDRFRKRTVMIAAKFAELLIMLLGLLVLWKLPELKELGTWGILLVLFLMATQTAFFSPSFNGIMPEIFREKELSRANGNMGMLIFVAIIVGTGTGFLLKEFVGSALYICGIIFSACSFVGLLAAVRIPAGRPGNRQREWQWNIIFKYIEGFNFLRKSKSLFFAVLGESYFFSLGAAVQTVLITFAMYKLGIARNNAIDIGLLQFACAIGMGLGCYLAGVISGKKVELGLVPFGAMMMVVFLLLTALCPGNPIYFGANNGHMLYPWVLFFLIMIGLGSGFFVIPLRAYQQQKTDPGERGKFFGNVNIICFSMILLTSLIMFYLTAGGADTQTEAGRLMGIQQYCLNMNPVAILVTMALVTLVLALYVFWLIPEFAVRFAIVVLTNTLYRLRIRGAENIPERGPALLVANHVSFVDGLLITACSSRIVRFLMHEDFYDYPLLHPFVKWAGFIRVPGHGPKRMHDLFDKTRELLRQGEVVCIFPEGKITRNGIMSEFKRGVSKLIPDDMDVPVIPIRLGMLWGSIFSYYFGKVTFRFPRELPHPASVTVGKPVSKNLSPFELRQVLSELAADTEMEARREERPLHYKFCKIAKRRPFGKLIKDFDGPEVSNFSLLVRSMILSREVLKLSPESKYVGIFLPNLTATAASILGVMMVDKVPAMLNFSASREALRHCIGKAEITCILTSRKFLKKINFEPMPEMVFLEDVATEISKSRKFGFTLLAALLPHQELMNLMAPETHRDVFSTAMLLFSSGSSGMPKGVLLSHHNINSDVYSFIRIMGWRSRDKVTGNLPLFHSFGLTTSFWLPLMLGVEVVYIKSPLDADSVVKAVGRHKLTLLPATPTFLQTYMRKAKREQLRSLRLVITGAEKLRTDIAEKFKEKTGLTVIEGYGCTELSPVVSINISNSILNLGSKAGVPGSVGAPMPGICAKIVDIDTRRQLPANREGLLYIKGPNVMQSYLKEPEKTAEVIHNGWYNTGDVAKMNESGYITITGRMTRFSKIGGEMVPHQLVEKHIDEIIGAEALTVAVTGGEDPGKGEKLLALYTDLPMTPEEIITKLRERKLPNLWIPKPSDFYKVDHLPMLGSGKLDLMKLKQFAQNVINEAARKS